MLLEGLGENNIWESVRDVAGTEMLVQREREAEGSSVNWLLEKENFWKNTDGCLTC